MSSEDLTLINRHLVELRQEVAELQGALEQMAKLEHEATLDEVCDLLAPAIAGLARLESEEIDGDAQEVVRALSEVLPALGLSPLSVVGEVLELWPEQANEDLTLDHEVPDRASMARVKIVAGGWSRGKRVIVRPLAQVISVIDGEETHV